MTIRQEEGANGVWILAVNGRLDQALTPTLEQHLSTLLDEQHTQLIVDLSQTSYINSGGLRTLVTGWRKARQQKGNLVLCGLNGRLQEIFGMVGFDQLFQIFPTRQAAQMSFTQA
jgi:anti-sigma B factor antagonist